MTKMLKLCFLNTGLMELGEEIWAKFTLNRNPGRQKWAGIWFERKDLIELDQDSFVIGDICFDNWDLGLGFLDEIVELEIDEKWDYDQTNRHLNWIVNIYDTEKDGEAYPVGDIDCYFTNELDDKDYNFIIYDCGELKEPTTMFRKADIRLLCGSILPHEAKDYLQVLNACKDMEIHKLGLFLRSLHILTPFHRDIRPHAADRKQDKNVLYQIFLLVGKGYSPHGTPSLF